MIQINLSEEQAKSLLNSMGWRYGSGEYERLDVNSDVAKEVFIQLEQQLMPRSTSAAELASFKHDAGYTERTVIEWKRKWGMKCGDFRDPFGQDVIYSWGVKA